MSSPTAEAEAEAEPPGASGARGNAIARLVPAWSLAGFDVVAEFELRALWSTKSALVGTFVLEPIVYMALLAAGLQGLVAGTGGGGGGDYITFVFPGLLALQAIREFTRAVFRCTAERRWGLLALKRLSGVGRWATCWR